jgi:hypothetical protein
MGYLSSWTYFYMNSPCTFCTHTFIWIILNKLTLFLIIKPTRCTNFSYLFLEWSSTRFRQFLCPTSGVFHCTHSNGICHTGLLTACEQDQDGTAVTHALISQIYSWNETIHVSDSFSVQRQEFFTVHTAMVYVIADSLWAGSGWNCSYRCTNFSNLLLEWNFTRFRQFLCPMSGVFHCTHSNDTYHCCVYSEKLLTLGRGTVQNMQSFIPRINKRN